MRRVAALACALAVVTWCDGAAAGQGKLTAAHVNAAQRWLDGVVNHVPGQSDQHVAALVSMTAVDWRTLFEALPRALQTITGDGVGTSTTEEKAIVTLAKNAVQMRGASELLRRAAVMHADAAMSGGRMPLPEIRLLDQHAFIESRDGEVDRVVSANGHWPFARGLLDLLRRPRAADDPFAATWYHANAAYLMRVQQFGEVGTHLGRAAQLFPLDARIQFDLGALSELLGLPRSRLVLDDPRTQHTLGSSSGQRLVADPRLLQSAGLLAFSRAGSIPTREAADAEAELRYRRALELDKTFVEARVRLGRLLTLRARYVDALKELDTAIAAKPDSALLFYANLFAGRAARGAAQSERAAVYFARALSLYPDAQSALLGASQVALVRADLAGALARVQRLETAMQSHPYDPWWDYHLGAGRNHGALLKAMWASVK